MWEPPDILDYGRPTPRPALRNYSVDPRTGAFVCAIGCGALWATFFLLTRVVDGNTFSLVLLIALAAASLGLGALSFVEMIRLARMREMTLLRHATVAMVVCALASGMIQITRCHHATYVQLVIFHIAIAGKPCNSPQSPEPWWLPDR
jgi:hypothetical protein